MRKLPILSASALALFVSVAHASPAATSPPPATALPPRPSADAPPAPPSARTPSPPATADASADADALDLAALRGKVVYLDFWASWCAPCKKSFPWLTELQDLHQDEGLVVVAVNVDRERGAADAFLAKNPHSFRIVYDPEGQLAREFDLKGMPSSFLIGRDGTRRSGHVGFRDGDRARLKEEIASLLKEPEAKP